MILALDGGKYLHTAYAVSNIPEEFEASDWSLTSQEGMGYIGTFIDSSSTEDTDPTKYSWDELLDTEVDDTDSDGVLPPADFQAQIDALQDQINILQGAKDNLQASINKQAVNISSAADVGTNAQNIANAANDIATATNQYFWADTNGVHISNEESNPDGDRNTLYNTIGMLFRKGANYLLAILAGGASGTDPKGLAIYDGAGNNASNVVASFTDSGAVIGKNATGESRSSISNAGMQIIQNVNGTDVPIANLGYGEGYDDYGNLVDAPFYTLGERVAGSSVGNYSVAEGDQTLASGYASHAEGGTGSEATGMYAHSEGQAYAEGAWSHAENVAGAEGEYSHAEGAGTTDAEGTYAHAEGSSNANSPYTHAEGYQTYANGNYSHSEGQNTTAYGTAGHAEGFSTRTEGNYSHAQNKGTQALGRSATALGEYNEQDIPAGDADTRATYAVIVGNGTNSSNRSNALTVDWAGNVDIASGASYKINGTALAASDVGAVPTTRTVNSKALSSDITLSASDVGAVPSSDITGSMSANYTGKYTMGKCTILTGSVTVTVNSSNTNVDKAVSFGSDTFKYTPAIELTMANIGGSYYQRCTAAGPSTTGFTCRVRAGGAPGDVLVMWVAIGELV